MERNMEKIKKITIFGKNNDLTTCHFSRKRWRFSNFPHIWHLTSLFMIKQEIIIQFCGHCWDDPDGEKIKKIENIRFFGKNDELSPCHFCRKSDDFRIYPKICHCTSLFMGSNESSITILRTLLGHIIDEEIRRRLKILHFLAKTMS